MTDNKRSGLSGQALKAANSAISKLRKAGLYAGKAARGQPTAYALKLVKKFSDVIRGTAKAVKADKATREAYSGKFETHGKRVIVPIKPQNTEIVRVSKTKSGEAGKIRIYGDTDRGRYKREIEPKKTALRPLKKGERYAVAIKRGRKGTSYRYFDNYADAKAFITSYVRRTTKADKAEQVIQDWLDDIEIRESR